MWERAVTETGQSPWVRRKFRGLIGSAGCGLLENLGLVLGGVIRGPSNSLTGGLLSPMGEAKGLAAQSKPKGCFGVFFFAAWVICRAVKTIVSILNLRKMAWDCVAGSLAARWHAWMTHWKKKSRRREHRALFIMRPPGNLMGPWTLPLPGLCCQGFLGGLSGLLPRESCYCSWKNFLAPPGFSLCPEMAVEDSSGRDWAQERKQLCMAHVTWGKLGRVDSSISVGLRRMG